ncbi:MAG TPA: hypothetical protein VGN52_20925 [Burkholderiales bacterium]|jgi:hypothetical protein
MIRLYLGIVTLCVYALSYPAALVIEYIDAAEIFEPMEDAEFVMYKFLLQLAVALITAGAIVAALWRRWFGRLARPVAGANWALAGVLVRLVVALSAVIASRVPALGSARAPLSFIYRNRIDLVISVLCIIVGLALASRAARARGGA